MKKTLNSTLHSQHSTLFSPFTLPFKGLALLVWIYFVFCYLASPSMSVWQGNLADPDNYMYLAQTVDWINGQSWFDNMQHRLNPPDGTPLHFTRFAQMPMAAITYAIQSFGFPLRGSALFGSFILPILYFGIFLYVIRKTAEHFVRHDWARLTAFFTIFSAPLMFKFSPSQVDHHGLQAILMLLGISFTVIMFKEPKKIIWAVLSGLIFSLSLAIALEVLPFFMLAAMTVGLWCIFSGRKAALPTCIYAASLLVFSTVLLLLTRGFSGFFETNSLFFSFTYIALIIGIAVSLLFAAAFSLLFSSAAIRFAFSGFAAFICGLLFLYTFPELLDGPYGAVDKEFAGWFFPQIQEAAPLPQRFSGLFAFYILLLPMLGFFTSAFIAANSADWKKWAWILLSSFLAFSIVFSVVYQVRIIIYMGLFSIIPLVALTYYSWNWIGQTFQNRKKFWAEILLIVALGPLTIVILPAFSDNRSFTHGMLMFAAQRSERACYFNSNTRAVLNGSPYSDRVMNILTPIDIGPEVLFYTGHSTYAAAYHTNAQGNIFARNFFIETDADKAKAMLRDKNIDLILLCRLISGMYLPDDVMKGPGYKGLSKDDKNKVSETMIGRLLGGQNVPSWAKPVPIEKDSYFILYEVSPFAD